MSLIVKCHSSATSSRVQANAAAPPKVQDAQSARRAILLSGSLFTLSNAAPKAALALIPDDEDEELLRRAKENRAKTLAQQRATTRSFMESEGLANGKLNQDLIPVQKAVYKLAASGKQLEAGDVKQASRTLSEDWVQGLSTAATKFSASYDEVQSQLSKLQSAASKENLLESKTTFVALVEALKAWASASGIQGSLKGL